MADSVKALIRERAVVKGQLTRVQTYLKTNPSDIDELKLRKKKLEQLEREFQRVQLQIDVAQDLEDEDPIRVAFEDQYFECATKINKIIREVTESNIAPLSATTSIASDRASPLPARPMHALLPKIQIPNFDGSPTDWHNFHDTFKTIVHENSEIPAVQKFHLLKNALRGEVVTVVASLNATEENYLVAWQLLQKRCNRPRQIIQAHLKSLVQLEDVTKDSPSGLRTLIEQAQMHVNALRALKQPIEYWDAFLVYIVIRKVDIATRRIWERSLENEEMPKFTDLAEFLTKQARGDEYDIVDHHADKQTRVSRPGNSKGGRITQGYLGTRMQCVICKNSHMIYTCPQFRGLTPRERTDAARRANHCLNCLRPDHSTARCDHSGCRVCKRRHNTLLHFADTRAPGIVNNSSTGNSQGPVSAQVKGQANDKGQIPAEGEQKSLCATCDSEVLLGTALVTILDQNNQPYDCRALLDSGSQSNFITEGLAERLGLKQTTANLPFSGLGQQRTMAQYLVRSTIQSKVSPFSSEVSLVALPSITSLLPARQINRQAIKIPRNVKLADPDFHKPAQVDVLLGSAIFYQLLRVGQIKQEHSPIVLQKTRLGWLVTGETTVSCGNVRSPAPRTAHLATTLEEQVVKFWELEQVPSRRHFSAEEIECEQFYNKTTRRDHAGKYVVRLPFRQNKDLLGDSYELAKQRFISLEKRLAKDQYLKQQYTQFLHEYLQLGHMTDISQCDNKEVGCYLPHQPVLKESSLTTKIRVVFDGSAKTNSNVSLNDTLMVGPTIQDDLLVIILRFRLHKVVLTADIEKMFRQIRDPSTDAVFQKIMWRDQPSDPIRIFRLDTVTYGTAAAPFLAVRTLQRLAEDEQGSFPLGAAVLRKDFYVDDLLTGADSYEKAKIIKSELLQLLRRGGFNLRKWASNDTRLSQTLDTVDSSQAIPLDSTTKVLGIQWNPQRDMISYSVQPFDQTAHVTKRTILSKTAQIFDPLGLLGPVVVRAKILIQQLWKENLAWDESVPPQIYTSWVTMQQELHRLERFELPRRLMVDEPSNVELHGFSDASETAYGAALYIRSTSRNTQHLVRLVCAKSRVAPLKTVTLPRLELCAATLLARLVKASTCALGIKFSRVTLWTDSTIVLHWIHSSAHQLKTFVANRVAEIQTSTEANQWRHVASTDNPADAISRGQSPTDFLKNKQWLTGPRWLSQDESTWPVSKIDTIIELPELKTKVGLIAKETSNPIWKEFSSIRRLNRFVARALRVVRRNKKPSLGKGELTPDEMQKAHLRIVQLVQEEAFSQTIAALKTGKQLHPKDRLLPLSPFIAEGILRVGGRLKNAPISFAQKHPILLPKFHPVTTLLIREHHERYWHAGTLATLNAIRQAYWIVDGKNAVRKVLHSCIRCRKLHPTVPKYVMGDLPGSRVTPTRPFENTGIDYCGPFQMKEKKFRNTKTIKAYIAVFVCFCTKAVHLELVTELTTEAFLAALRRFFGRRGKAKNIYSDNATNFVGANRQQRELLAFVQSETYHKETTHALADEGINWHFSPPRSPHFGGLWEAAVKSFKKHLYATVGDALFTYEQFNTLIVEIEAILNSRPITPLSSDPHDLSALTPGHFLIGDTLKSVPEHDWQHTAKNRLSIYQQLQKVRQQFWTRWHREYLNQLHTRSKWHIPDARSIAVGDLVTIKEENAPPLHWSIGRIMDTHPGDDGIVRVASVKTSKGIYKRSVKLLCPLLVEVQNNTS